MTSDHDCSQPVGSWGVTSLLLLTSSVEVNLFKLIVLLDNCEKVSACPNCIIMTSSVTWEVRLEMRLVAKLAFCGRWSQIEPLSKHVSFAHHHRPEWSMVSPTSFPWSTSWRISTVRKRLWERGWSWFLCISQLMLGYIPQTSLNNRDSQYIRGVEASGSHLTVTNTIRLTTVSR